jgi:hypothetical protein
MFFNKRILMRREGKTFGLEGKPAIVIGHKKRNWT